MKVYYLRTDRQASQAVLLINGRVYLPPRIKPIGDNIYTVKMLYKIAGFVTTSARIPQSLAIWQ